MGIIKYALTVMLHAPPLPKVGAWGKGRWMSIMVKATIVMFIVSVSNGDDPMVEAKEQTRACVRVCGYACANKEPRCRDRIKFPRVRKTFCYQKALNNCTLRQGRGIGGRPRCGVNQQGLQVGD